MSGALNRISPNDLALKELRDSRTEITGHLGQITRGIVLSKVIIFLIY